jgi:hypothetical protein
MVLAKSLKATNPEVKFLVCLVEREIPKEAIEYKYFDYIILAKDMGIENFDRFIFKHSIVEAATSVKGNIFIYMFNKFKGESKFVYLDPDIKVYGELKELNEILDENEIVLTPHLTISEDIKDAVMDNELCALQHGVFNLGFLALSRGEEGERFAKWWASRLDMFCYDDIPKGIFTDQKWVDLAPCFFNTYILKHPGYNIAPWNLSKRKISLQNGAYYVNDEPLRFFHYSGFDSGANEGMINKYVPNLKDSVYTLRDVYVKEMQDLGQNELGKIPWSYNYYHSGQQINRISRILFRDIPELWYKYENPFELSDQEFEKYRNKSGEPNQEELKSVKRELDEMKNSKAWKIVQKLKGNKLIYKLCKSIMG